MFASFRNASVLLSLLLAACQTTAPTTQETAAVETVTTPTAPLRNTRWVLRTLNSQPVAVPANGEAYLLLRTDELRAEGNGGCNRFRGSFEQPADGQLKFGPLMSTKMACPDLQTESGLMSALQAARTYQISGDTLRLFGETTAQPSAVFHAVYLR
ncbi:META domain-containing protein [Hymenobacter norwichensis]|uniref:META domain-containing protein n=1 Tax=Hymenobacter norwichensis TaxID=223903 RepID=UPI0003B4B739|nr:META domain-containing protein [Hymenobacter norwichensis]